MADKPDPDKQGKKAYHEDTDEPDPVEQYYQNPTVRRLRGADLDYEQNSANNDNETGEPEDTRQDDINRPNEPKKKKK